MRFDHIAQYDRTQWRSCFPEKKKQRVFSFQRTEALCAYPPRGTELVWILDWSPISKKGTVQYTPVSHPPNPLMKGRPLQPVGKGLGVCSKGMPFKTSENHWSPMLLSFSQVISKMWILLLFAMNVFLNTRVFREKVRIGGWFITGNVDWNTVKHRKALSKLQNTLELSTPFKKDWCCTCTLLKTWFTWNSRIKKSPNSEIHHFLVLALTSRVSVMYNKARRLCTRMQHPFHLPGPWYIYHTSGLNEPFIKWSPPKTVGRVW